MLSSTTVEKLLTLREDRKKIYGRLNRVDQKIAKLEKILANWLEKSKTKRGVINSQFIELEITEKVITQWAKAFAYHLPQKTATVKKDRRFSKKKIYKNLKISQL